MAEVWVKAGGAAAIGAAGGAVAVVRSTVDAVADAVDTASASAVDLTTLAELLQQAVREGVSAGLAAQRIDEQAPMFGAVGRILNANTGLLALIALVVAVLALMHDRAANERDDPPPTVTVQIEPDDRAQVERIVQERLREQTIRTSPGQRSDPPVR